MNEIISAWTELNKWLHHLLGGTFKDVLWSIIAIFMLSILYSFLSLFIKNQKKSERKKYYSLNTIRNSFFIIFIFIELFLWSGELKTLFISAAAITAATIVTFKEVIMCVVGSFLISSNKLFSIGEYIEYDNMKGKIIDKNMLYTKILIGESFQTKELNIPNAVFLTTRVINLSKFGKYQTYELNIAIARLQDLLYYQGFFNEVLNTLLESELALYTQYFNEKKTYDIFFEMPAEYYEVKADLNDIEQIKIHISYLALPSKHKKLEQDILQAYIKEASTKTTI